VRQAETVWDEGEREAFVNFIAANPVAGDVTPQTGGVRKVRWARAGTGKRGGARNLFGDYSVCWPKSATDSGMTPCQ
jgi:hypothetical protein